MASQFKYKALAPDGASLTGVMTAENSSQVVEYISSQNLTPISIYPARERLSFSFLGFFKGTDYANLIMFTNNLATMYRAGIPLLKALSIIRIGPEGSKFNRAIQQIRFKIQSGKSLSQAMEDCKDIFSQVYVNSIAAGEESGKLDYILSELALMLEKELEISRLVKSGIRYPVIVLTVVSLAFIVLMAYVVPRFMDFYGSFGAQLPLPTRILISTSDLFSKYWWVISAVVFLILFGFKKLVQNKKGKLLVDKTLLKLPIVGDLIVKGNIARFSLMFRILFKSGLPIIKCLSISAGAVKNSVISLEINRLENLFSRGLESDIITERFVFFPDMARQMIYIGLESGSLENMLNEIGIHYSKEVQYSSRHLTAILEPILTLVISVFVLILALAIFLPMWNLIKVFNPG